LLNACKSTKELTKLPAKDTSLIPALKLSGGSSGMEQISPNSYLAVYDIKVHKKGPRVGLITITEATESFEVAPIEVKTWEAEGPSSDLESVCKIPDRPNEFLLAESGNWQGKFGRVFHIKLDISKLSAQVIGSFKIPMIHKNDKGLTGDQYEAMTCLPYDGNQKILLLGERGGSDKNPNGIVRWGILDLDKHQFQMDGKGKKGISIDAPGNWTNPSSKRDITDFHIDNEGFIWSAASEDNGDLGPFYSVIYQLGKINKHSTTQPIEVFEEIKIWKGVPGFKIEAVSGPSKGIKANLSFGTEDEIYGGVWRAIQINH
jgi:hypothetical protein